MIGRFIVTRDLGLLHVVIKPLFASQFGVGV